MSGKTLQYITKRRKIQEQTTRKSLIIRNLTYCAEHILNQKKEEETHYYPNGKIQLQTILTRERGGDSAESFGYHENGQLKFHESYQDYGRGLVKDGPRMEYDTDGKVTKAEIFWRGRGKAMVICSQCKKYTDPDKYACMHCRKGWKTNRKGK